MSAVTHTADDPTNDRHPYRRAESLARSKLANERTFAAWVRTGISVILVGLVLVRFLSEGLGNRAAFLVLGSGYVFLGIALFLFAVHHYRTTAKEIEVAHYTAPRRGFMVIATLIALLTLIMLVLVLLAVI